jgi:hypothetical protein
MLDPQKLTPEGLYALQSDTWAQGVEWEHERIIKLLGQQTCMYGEHCADGECSFHEILNFAIALINREQGVIQVSERDYDQIVEAIKGEK